MPIYEYQCAAGHMHIHLCRFDERPASRKCECGQDATLAVSLTGIGKVQGSHTPVKEAASARAGFVQVSPGVWEKGSSIDVDKIVDWRCEGCGKTGLAVDEPLPTCCGEVKPYVNEKAAHKDWFPLGGYFDRGLGVYFHTRRERDEYAKAHGLVEGAGVNEDSERALSIRHQEEEAVLDFWREEARSAKAAGEEVNLPKWVKDEIGWKD
jgi:hypothetical protein